MTVQRLRVPDLLRAAAAFSLLAGLVIGLPVALIVSVGWPLPQQPPTWQQVARAFTTGEITSLTIIKTLAVIVWLAWADLTVAVGVEVAALVRGRRARNVPVPGTLRLAIANLVASAALLVTGPTRAAVAVAHPLPDLQAAVPFDQTDHDRPNAADAVPPPPPTDAQERRGHPDDSRVVWTVRPRDTLWGIAERTLGDGLRWRDIARLNIGRPQPDGGSLTGDDDHIRPGWQLVLPDDATVPGRHQPDRPAAARPETATASIVTVDPGDTLWDLAEHHLDDPLRWPSLFERNRGREQPDGRRLADPDLLHPGWVLDLPPAGEIATPHQTGAAPSDRPRSPGRAGPSDDTRHYEGSPDTQGEAPTGTAPATEGPTYEADREHDEHDIGESDGGLPWTQIVTVAGAGLLAAGVAATIDRIRRAQRRRRPVGRHISLPQGRPANVELGIRGLADQTTASDVQHAVDAVVAHRQDPEDPAASRIVLVSTSATELGVHLARADHDAPDGWQVTDGGHTWTTPIGDARPSRSGMGDGPSLFVSLGTTAQGRRRVQLNLAHVGVLGIDADPDRRRATLLGFAVELATAMTVCHPQILCVGLAGHLDALEWIEQVDGPAEVVAAFQQRADDIQDRTDTELRDIQPLVALFDVELDPSTVDRLRAAVERGRGRLAVAIAGTEQLTWTLRMNAGRWRLSPVDVDITPIELGRDELQHVGELVRAAKHRFYVPPHDNDETVPEETPETATANDSDSPSAPTNEHVPADEDAGQEMPNSSADGGQHDDDAADPSQPIAGVADHDRTDSPPRRASDASDDSVAAASDQGAETGEHPEAQILGAVNVKGVGEWPTTKSKEAVIYLATRRDGADGDTLMEALWPREEPKLNRLQTEISRARKVLGNAPDGQPYLPLPRKGIYRLDHRVRTDLDRFRDLVRLAAERPDDAIDLLQAALDLIDDDHPPWSATPKGCYSWASFQIHAVEQSVADAAHKLAQLYLTNSEPSKAISAARTGLVADGHYEALYRDLMEAAAATGNTMEIHRIMQDLRGRLAEETGANDADDWMDPETVQLYDKLTRGHTTTAN